MGNVLTEFGNLRGEDNRDIRFSIAGSGKKSGLAIIASYERSNFTAFTDASFYGRLVVLEGLPVGNERLAGAPVAVPGEIDLGTILEGRILVDVALHTLGPFVFFYPLASLEGGTGTSQGGTLTVILGRAFTTVLGDTFRGRLTVAGQTT